MACIIFLSHSVGLASAHLTALGSVPCPLPIQASVLWVRILCCDYMYINSPQFHVILTFTWFLFEQFRCPVHTNQIPRHIPQQSFFTKPLFGIIIGGVLPFGCIFIQLFFILNSIWWVLYLHNFKKILIVDQLIFLYFKEVKFWYGKLHSPPSTPCPSERFLNPGNGDLTGGGGIS